jgi:hypothetical protein
MDTPRSKDLFIVCPHLKIEDNDEITGLTSDCATIELVGKNLMLCGPCWEVVRARVYDSIVRLAVKSQPSKW